MYQNNVYQFRVGLPPQMAAAGGLDELLNHFIFEKTGVRV